MRHSYAKLVTLVVLTAGVTFAFFSVQPVEGIFQHEFFVNQNQGSAYLRDQAEPSSIHDSRLDQFLIQSPQLRVKEREIYVYLPPDYFTSEKVYPVIYFQDGGIIFSTNGESDSRFNVVMDQLYAEGKIDGIIAVGIGATGNRWDEYSPWVNVNMDIWVPWYSEQVEGGEGDAYLDFVINTLKPHIDKKYRTLRDRENTAIGGFSMGGLISIYAGLTRPEVFSMVMAQSPAIWFAESDRAWNSRNLLIQLIQSQPLPQDVKFYLDIGTNEWEEQPMPLVTMRENELVDLDYPFVWLDGVNLVFNALQSHYIPDENLMLVIEKGGVHDHPSWHKRSDTALLWLFGATDPQTESSLIIVKPPERVMLVETSQNNDMESEGNSNAPDFTVEEVNPRSYELVMLFFGVGALITGIVLRIFLSRKRYPQGK